jgi:hypothetical protein
VIRAIAIIEVGAFRILTCPANPEMEGILFATPRAAGRLRLGQYTVVKFCPNDQFAYECQEALQP